MSSITDWIQTFLLGAAVIVASSEISSVRSEARRTRTLGACDRYDFDPVLNAELDKLHKAKNANLIGKDADPNPPTAIISELKTSILAVLNYLDGLAIGIEQAVYDAGMIEGHMKNIVLTHCADLLRANLLDKIGLKTTDFLHLGRLQKRYENPDTKEAKKFWRLF